MKKVQRISAPFAKANQIIKLFSLGTTPAPDWFKSRDFLVDMYEKAKKAEINITSKTCLVPSCGNGEELHCSLPYCSGVFRPRILFFSHNVSFQEAGTRIDIQDEETKHTEKPEKKIGFFKRLLTKFRKG